MASKPKSKPAPTRSASLLPTILWYLALCAGWYGVWLLNEHLKAQHSPLVATYKANTTWWDTAKLVVWIVPASLVAWLRGQRQQLRWLGLSSARGIPTGLVVGAAWVGVLAGLVALFGQPPPVFRWSLGVLSACAISPVIEEIAFRGYAQTWLRDAGLRPVAAILVATVMFFCLHLIGWSFLGVLDKRLIHALPGVIGVSLLAGFLRHRTSALWAPIILHAMNNLWDQGLVVELIHRLR